MAKRPPDGEAPPGHVRYEDLLASKARGTPLPADTGETNPIIKWAEAYRILADGQPYRIEHHPPMRGIYDAFLDFSGDAKVVAVGKGAQLGATEMMINCVCYTISEIRASMLVLMEDEDKVKSMMRERLGPAMRREPLASILGQEMEKGARGSQYHANYTGGSLNIRGSHSTSSYSSRDVRFVMLDEFSRYPANLKGEGDPLSLMRARTTIFAERAKILCISTPTDPFMAPGSFSQVMARGDMRVYMMPCVHCGKPFEWTMEKDRETFRVREEKTGLIAWMECPSCNKAIYEPDKKPMVAAGEWVATQERRVGEDVVSFQYPAFLSHQLSWAVIAQEKVATDRELHSPAALYNLRYGLPYDESVPPPKPQDAKAKFSLGYKKGVVPSLVKFLSAAVDVQHNWMKFVVVGWGAKSLSFVVDSGAISHSIDSAAGRRALRDLFHGTWPCEQGGKMGVTIGCIDSGFRATSVYDVVADYPQPVQAQGYSAYWSLPDAPCVFPIKGSDSSDLSRIVHQSRTTQLVARTGRDISVLIAGSHIAKMDLHSSLNQARDYEEDNLEETAMAGTAFFPKDLELEFFEELAAEELRITKDNTGKVRRKFHQTKERNEALDCMVYARVAAEVAGLSHPEDHILDILYDYSYQGDGTEEEKPAMSFEEARDAASSGPGRGMTFEEARDKALAEKEKRAKEKPGESGMTFEEARDKALREKEAREKRGPDSDIYTE